MSGVKREREVLSIDRTRPGSPVEEWTTTSLVRGSDGWTVHVDGPATSQKLRLSATRDAASVIADIEALHVIARQDLTRITTTAEVAAQLPLLLRAGETSEADAEAGWPEQVVEEEVDDWDFDLIGSSAVPVLYVNDARWSWWATTAGESALPAEPGDCMPAFDERWAVLRFTEEGSMTSGVDEASIGLVTPTLVCSRACRDEDDPDPVNLSPLERSPAEHVVNWLFHSEYTSMLLGVWGGREDLLARLFVQAAQGVSNGRPVCGDGLMPDPEGFGTHSSSRWTLTLDLTREQLDEAVRLVAARPGVPTDVRRMAL